MTNLQGKTMETILRKKEAKDRPLFLNITGTLEDGIEEYRKYLKTTKSGFTRHAIRVLIEIVEKERRTKRLRAAYEANYPILEKEAEDWDTATIENLQ